MNYEQEINKLKAQLNSLQSAFLQAQKNQVPITSRVDESASKIVDLTPYMDTKTAYIGDTEVIFTDVPSGSWFVSFSNNVLATKITRDNRTLIVEFLPLEEVTQVTITVQ